MYVTWYSVCGVGHWLVAAATQLATLVGLLAYSMMLLYYKLPFRFKMTESVSMMRCIIELHIDIEKKNPVQTFIKSP